LAVGSPSAFLPLAFAAAIKAEGSPCLIVDITT
jgi:hypothetical protein